MREKVIRIGTTVLLLAAVLAGGYLIGARMERMRNDRRIAELAGEDYSDRGTKIAIVNLDEGVDTGSGTTQYAAQLLPYAKVEYTVTGLQDARIGVETGLYGSYVVIPSDFSRTVYSINTQPVMSHLSYVVSSELTREKREQAIHNIAALKENLNNSLTEIYLSSVMKEFHRAQDASEEIMANDKKDAELLEQINAGNLVTMVELPEMVQVENPVAVLDLTEQYAGSESLLASLETTYQGFLTKGQNDLNQTKEKSTAINDQMTEAGNALAEANDALENISLDEELAEFAQKSEAARSEIEAAMGGYDAYIAEYNANSEAGNASRNELRAALTEYENTETAYQTLLEGYRAGPDRDHYALIDQEAYIKKLAEAMETANIGGVPAPYPSWVEFFTAATEQMQETDYCQTAALIPDQAPTQNNPGEAPWPQIEAVKKPSEVTGADGTDIKTSVFNKVDDFRTLVEGAAEDILRKKIRDISGAYTDAAEQYNVAGQKTGELSAELGDYDLAAYIDRQEVDAIENDLNANSREIEAKVSEYTGAYDQYVSDVYNAAGENMTAVQESVAEAEEESERLLTEGLEEAKTSRSENNKVNSILLGELSEKLPYTRIGDVENKEVFDFMASPLLMEEQEPEVSNGKKSTEEAGRESGIHAGMAFWIIIILICGVGLAGLIRLVIVQGTKRRALEF